MGEIYIQRTVRKCFHSITLKKTNHFKQVPAINSLNLPYISINFRDWKSQKKKIEIQYNNNVLGCFSFPDSDEIYRFILLCLLAIKVHMVTFFTLIRQYHACYIFFFTNRYVKPRINTVKKPSTVWKPLHPAQPLSQNGTLPPKKKNCTGIAVRQNCSAVEKFKYHCVIDAYRNRLMEVCAPTRLIFSKAFFHM